MAKTATWVDLSHLLAGWSQKMEVVDPEQLSSLAVRSRSMSRFGAVWVPLDTQRTSLGLAVELRLNCVLSLCSKVDDYLGSPNLSGDITTTL